MRCGRPSELACASARRTAPEPGLMSNRVLQCRSLLRPNPRAEAQLRQPARTLLVEAVQLMEDAQVSLANSADGDLIMAEDLEEDLAAAAAAAVAATAATAATAAGTTTRAPTSSTWQTATARPGTVPATDAS